VILGKKVRLYPTKEHEQKLWQSVGTARFIYNWTLARQEENYTLKGTSKNGGKFISDNDLRKELTILKKTELKPSFYNDTSKLKVKESSVLIEKVGWVTIKKNSIPINCKYTNPRISFDGKYWFIAVGIEKENPIVALTTESIGIDLGIKDLAICSNGMTFKNINKTRVVKQLEKRLRRLQRRVSGKYLKNKEGGKFVKTSNIIKIEKQIKLLHRKLANIRSNYNHQATNKIVKTKPSRVVMETLNIKSMMKNKHLSKAISKQCLYEFKKQMQYKCEFNGIEFIEADKWYPSSKTCSKCGHVKPKFSLSERTYICEECGLVIDRDYNASINLSRYELVG